MTTALRILHRFQKLSFVFNMNGNLCRMHDCNNIKVPPSQTWVQHQNRWYQHAIRYGRQSLLGFRRMVRCSEEERLPWIPAFNQETQQHDEEPTVAGSRKDNYFVAPRFYCVETICAPCGVVIAWTKFAKAESPTNILNFLYIQHQNYGQTIFVLTRPVWFFELPSAIILGKFGRRHHGL